MNNDDYEQKKQQCWEEYIAKHGLKNAIPEDAFSFTFDRAYALGKLQASGGQVKETISQDFRYKQNKAKNAAKPKFKIGQHVMYKGLKVKILNYHKRYKHPYYILLPDRDAYVKESDLGPCTEPKESRNLSQETANCDKQFDKLLEMNTEAERRKFAAMAMQGMLSFDSCQNAETIAKSAVHHADTLIAELNKKKQ